MSAVWHSLSDPWSAGFMVRAFVEVALIGVAGGLLGCWIVLYRLAYSAESLAHSMLPGLVLALLLGLPLVLGAGFGLLIGALAIALASRVPVLDNDAAVAIAVTGLFGLGGLLALSADTPPRLQDLLFGDVLGVTGGDLVISIALVALVGGVLAAVHRNLMLVGFDRSSAGSFGGRPALADLTLLLLTAVTTLVAVQALGNLLAVAVLVGPALAAFEFRGRLTQMMGAAVLIALASAFAGLYVSYYSGLAAGAAIAAGLTLCFPLARLVRVAATNPASV